MRECEAKTVRFPKFIAVAFHDIGQTIETVRQFNLARLRAGSPGGLEQDDSRLTFWTD